MQKINPQPYFDKDKNFYFPSNLKFGGQLSPPLNPAEWFVWVFMNSKNLPKGHFKLLGSRSTIWRIKKKLREKGYI